MQKLITLLIAFLTFLYPFPSFAVENPGENLQKVGISPTLGSQINTQLTFTDSNGKQASLGHLLHPNAPTLLVPAYYDCPRLCGLLLGGVTKLLNELKLELGTDYKVLTVSFDPKEGPELAKKRAKHYYTTLKSPVSGPKGWKFLVGDQVNIDPLMNQIGFEYFEDKGEYAHTAAVIVLTPQGRISQYFTGISFSKRDLRLALVEASEGKIGNLIDHVLLYCYRFDPTKGKYTWVAFGIMRTGGALTLLLLGTTLLLLWKREKGKSQIRI